MKTLRQSLEEWTDWDVAEYHLGAALGLWPEWSDDDPWHGFKGVVWSANPVGDALDATLRGLVAAGLLQHDMSGSNDRVRAIATWDEVAAQDRRT